MAVQLASWLSKPLHFVGILGLPYTALWSVGCSFYWHSCLPIGRNASATARPKNMQLTGTLRAIEAEVLVLRADFLMPLWDPLKAAEPGPFPTMPVQKNFFVVFESNAAALGRIRDPKLITKIVSVYGQAKFLNDVSQFQRRPFSGLGQSRCRA